MRVLLMRALYNNRVGKNKHTLYVLVQPSAAPVPGPGCTRGVPRYCSPVSPPHRPPAAGPCRPSAGSRHARPPASTRPATNVPRMHAHSGGRPPAAAGGAGAAVRHCATGAATSQPSFTGRHCHPRRRSLPRSPPRPGVRRRDPRASAAAGRGGVRSSLPPRQPPACARVAGQPAPRRPGRWSGSRVRSARRAAGPSAAAAAGVAQHCPRRNAFRRPGRRAEGCGLTRPHSPPPATPRQTRSSPRRITAVCESGGRRRQCACRRPGMARA